MSFGHSVDSNASEDVSAGPLEYMKLNAHLEPACPALLVSDDRTSESPWLHALWVQTLEVEPRLDASVLAPFREPWG